MFEIQSPKYLYIACMLWFQATNRVEEAEESLKKHPRDADLEDELRRARNELQNARREKEQADSEQHFSESQRQQVCISLRFISGPTNWIWI